MMVNLVFDDFGRFDTKYDDEMTERLYMRLTPEHKKMFQETAALFDMDTSDFWRETMIEIATKLIEEKPPPLPDSMSDMV